MASKRDLKRQYKESRREMGIIVFLCNPTGKAYICATQDTKAINSITFQLNAGSFPIYPNLKKDWKEYGPENFTVKVAEVLEYDKDESKTDYSEDLAVLLEYWKEQYENWEEIKG